MFLRDEPQSASVAVEREMCMDNLLVRINVIIKMIYWTGLVPWEFEFPFPGSRIYTFLAALRWLRRSSFSGVRSWNSHRGRVVAGLDSEVGIRRHGKGNSKLPWRKAGQPRHLVDVEDSHQ